MPPASGKRKEAAPADAPDKRGRGGGGRGQGCKRSAANTPGVDDPDAPKRSQAKLTLGSLLGFRVPKNSEVVNVEAAAAARDEPMLKWSYTRHEGGDDEEEIEQKARAHSRVQYDLAEDEGAVTTPVTYSTSYS